ncbi:hypothetical protein [Clostridium estertheticum]|uniref:Uncharacterized protein n=1 Tax=Clostridium estertheticum subsp. estertheticum TaxID=1552 RepID=A0A1J0GJK8_9CLOT|nr:hypothetical protein [Clostridium estertheticum]APC41521.1 hypothetical protein A7L45_16270 [Clostridium estertheticum subsp. estertheticum]
MEIKESTNLNSTLSITNADKMIKPVIAISSNLINGGNNLNLNFTITDAISIVGNEASAQVEMDSFMNALRTKMKELGYLIII